MPTPAGNKTYSKQSPVLLMERSDRQGIACASDGDALSGALPYAARRGAITTRTSGPGPNPKTGRCGEIPVQRTTPSILASS